MATPTPEELNKFCTRYAELSSTAKKLGFVRTLLTWMLFITVIGFVWAIFSKFKEMYTVQNFEKPMMEQAELIKPQVLASLKNVYDDAMPEIINAGKAGFEKVRPDLENSAHDELTKFTEFTGKHLETELASALHRITQHHEERLTAQFPKLMDEKSRVHMKRNLEKKIEKLMGDLLLEIHERYFTELKRLEKTLGRFRTAHFENPESKHDLALYYTHLWLMALDQYLLLNSGQFTPQPHKPAQSQTTPPVRVQETTPPAISPTAAPATATGNKTTTATATPPVTK